MKREPIGDWRWRRGMNDASVIVLEEGVKRARVDVERRRAHHLGEVLGGDEHGGGRVFARAKVRIDVDRFETLELDAHIAHVGHCGQLERASLRTRQFDAITDIFEPLNCGSKHCVRLWQLENHIRLAEVRLDIERELLRRKNLHRHSLNHSRFNLFFSLTNRATELEARQLADFRQLDRRLVCRLNASNGAFQMVDLQFTSNLISSRRLDFNRFKQLRLLQSKSQQNSKNEKEEEEGEENLAIGMPAQVTKPSVSPAIINTKSSGVNRKMHFFETRFSNATTRNSVSVSGIYPLNRIVYIEKTLKKRKSDAIFQWSSSHRCVDEFCFCFVAAVALCECTKHIITT